MHAEELQRRFSAAWHQLKTIAVTGTNGKTTTVSMIASIVEHAGQPSARLTTVGAFVAGKQIVARDATTEFLETVEAAVASGVSCLALEVTSKALLGGLARRWPADCAVFTNLSRDHLDMHGSAEAYLAAKAQLFVHLPEGAIAVLNADDAASDLIDEVTPPQVRRLRFGALASAELACDRIEVSRDGTTVFLRDSPLSRGLGGTLHLSVLGEVHGQNAMAAALACGGLGYEPQAIKEGLHKFSGVCGRFEVVLREPFVVVDYAHSPDGLIHTLKTARKLVTGQGRLICVFGCGGQRDRGKRPLMGRAADDLADHVILTSDNPRFEDPEQIADEVQAGAADRIRWERYLDRPAAIRSAVQLAGADDVVVIAGKGHERIQEVRGQELEMCDQELVRAGISARPGGENSSRHG